MGNAPPHKKHTASRPWLHGAFEEILPAVTQDQKKGKTQTSAGIFSVQNTNPSASSVEAQCLPLQPELPGP